MQFPCHPLSAVHQFHFLRRPPRTVRRPSPVGPSVSGPCRKNGEHQFVRRAPRTDDRSVLSSLGRAGPRGPFTGRPPTDRPTDRPTPRQRAKLTSLGDRPVRWISRRPSVCYRTQVLLFPFAVRLSVRLPARRAKDAQARRPAEEKCRCPNTSSLK